MPVPRSSAVPRHEKWEWRFFGSLNVRQRVAERPSPPWRSQQSVFATANIAAEKNER
jgi:hypothetical protein